jgi:hypothetical protein
MKASLNILSLIGADDFTAWAARQSLRAARRRILRKSMFRSFGIGTCSRFILLAHVLVGEPASTSPEHALE